MGDKRDDQLDEQSANAQELGEGEFLTPWGQRTSAAKQAACEHEWQRDGQTMMAVRWTCVKCGKSELR